MPDVSGIDKTFDYAVPEKLVHEVSLGCRVRVPLNGRRVSGWVVGVSRSSTVDSSRLLDIVAVSGQGVEPRLVPLTKWIAEHWWGPWRAVLASASAPRVRLRTVAPRRSGSGASGVAATSPGVVLGDGGGLLVVPPLASALSVVFESARRGPVLVACPTMRMARIGAAALRKRGLTTAELPEEWEGALAGVDVVIGARSAVLAPCRDVASIVVIDEHEESLREERAPTWSAAEVAVERARQLGIPVFVTSPVPSAWAVQTFETSTVHVESDPGWPLIEIEDLTRLPVAGSLLGSKLLSAAGTSASTLACILNTVGGARLLACSACSTLQSCRDCGSVLSQRVDSELECPRCTAVSDPVCSSCGRTAFKVLAGGTATLSRQISRATGRSVVEVTSSADEEWVDGTLFCGTEALLHRLPSADTVVFCDFDRDLRAPRVSAPREALALVAKAARLVGGRGRIVLQTRTPEHPLIVALGSPNPAAHVWKWNRAEVAMRRAMGFPPFAHMARIRDVTADDVELIRRHGCDVIQEGGAAVVRAADRTTVQTCVDELRSAGRKVRVYADPPRY